jgi:hypothetical protein
MNEGVHSEYAMRIGPGSWALRLNFLRFTSALLASRGVNAMAVGKLHGMLDHFKDARFAGLAYAAKPPKKAR